MDAPAWHRFQFAFTITYHYLFPQLTMGLALLLVVLKVVALRSGDSAYDNAARFWGKIFGLNFAMGVITGIPMEFQFGTNWANFSRYSGGVIGLTLALEGMFAFFAESAFLGLFLFGERKLGPKGHAFAAFMIFAGSWLSGYFIITTNAFMQHPVGHELGPDGALMLRDIGAFLLNPWALWQYAHTMSATVITASFVMAGLGAYWTLLRLHDPVARICVRVGVITGFIACVLQLFPTGDQRGKLLARDQPAALAAMEGKFESSARADLVIIGQPDVAARKLDNPIFVPSVLSYLAYGSFGATVKGLDDVPRENWPDNIELLYYAYHIMVGLGTMLLTVSGIAFYLLLRRRLLETRAMLWVLMLSIPFPYIATTAGWMTTELGRQPWAIYGLMRTAQATSPNVSTGNVAFSTLGFMGLYLLLGILFLFLITREINSGPPEATKGAFPPVRVEERA
ncbi:MAG TPA: cytochrome ubiquinol oxidase subunit I [Polyangiaceae bacterium]